MQAEVYSAAQYDAMLGVSQRLDALFNQSTKTIMSQRDIPGTTRAAIPLLAARGVRALTVGVNAATAPPGVPKTTPFIWRDNPSGAELLAMWHPGTHHARHAPLNNTCMH